ncbi:hypothetical protein CGK09_19540 [Vibrio parahaemolyticus]|uniref:hypothetical protein n=1 Tax=Vibrio parahaemolyticus TaxID=670 RepID=UPI00111D483B|nr:hypothetical protein [Vibrio parahaemolyticus]TOB23482.1 hypothetical protein CGK09_19540 [Vibrio parahaemolyticus]
MICLDTNSAQLLTFEFWNERADIIMAGVAILALMLTLQQLRSGRLESRRTTAYATYQEYLKNCADNPKFAYGNRNDIVSNGTTHEKYPWFVSQMLFTFEQVLETSKSDKQWKTAIRSQLERHAWYLKGSNTIKRKEWSDELTALISVAISNWQKSANVQNEPVKDAY